MTYLELLNYLRREFTDEQLNQDVTIYSLHEDEYRELDDIWVSDGTDSVLDDGHVFFVI